MAAPEVAAAAGGGDLPDGEMRTELQDMQMKMNEATDEVSRHRHSSPRGPAAPICYHQ